MRQGVWVRYFTAQSNAAVYSEYRGVLWHAVYCSGGVYPALALVAVLGGGGRWRYLGTLCSRSWRKIRDNNIGRNRVMVETG